VTPERIGKYEIKRPLGEGAYSSVYVALDTFAQRDVALKVMKPPPLDAKAARQQLRFFLNEAALAGKLRHPHIVSILDAGVHEDVRYLVMELVEGEPLTRYCRPDALLGFARIVGMVYKASKALEFANGLGVVHRDIKPANILVHGDFDIKVSDFGAAQVDQTEITQVSGVGSPAYMSPEQIMAEEVDWQSDMYSLGAVLYHLLTGRRPFSGATPYEIAENALNVPAPAPSAHRPDAPRALDEIVARAMAKSRADRYASWAEFWAALGKLLALDRGAALLSDAEQFAAARRLAFFTRFSDAELWEAVRPSVWRLHEAGEALIREDSADEHVYVIASGLLKVTRRGRLLNAVSPGECVGEMAYARREARRRNATVTAVEPTWAMRLRVGDIDTLSESCRARFNEAFLAIMAERLTALAGRLTE
jgi:tRNA A-37 threonylcarbamoyl transferase component Bud32